MLKSEGMYFRGDTRLRHTLKRTEEVIANHSSVVDLKRARTWVLSTLSFAHSRCSKLSCTNDFEFGKSWSIALDVYCTLIDTGSLTAFCLYMTGKYIILTHGESIVNHLFSFLSNEELRTDRHPPSICLFELYESRNLHNYFRYKKCFDPKSVKEPPHISQLCFKRFVLQQPPT